MSNLKDLGVKTYIFPQPVLIIGTYGEDGTPDAMNAAWGGTGDDDQVVICLSHTHATNKNYERTGAFTVGIPGADVTAAADLMGVASATKVPDKIARAGWTYAKAPHVDAPVFDQIKLTLECEFLGYDGYGRTVGKVVNVLADESILADDGQPDIAKLDPITYDPAHHGYHRIGEKVGQAFHDGLALK